MLSRARAALGALLALCACSDAPPLPGTVRTIAGQGVKGFADGVGEQALFYLPGGIAVDDGGVLYVADSQNHRIRRIDPGGSVSTLAGSGIIGFVDGPASAARFFDPWRLVLDGAGGLFVTEFGNGAIRRVDVATGEVTTVTGGGSGYQDGTLSEARFDRPSDIRVDPASGAVVVADTWNNTIRSIDLVAGLVTTIAGQPGNGTDDGPAVQARFFHPAGLVFDGQGDVLYVCDFENDRIRALSNGEVRTVAGSDPGYAEGLGASARFEHPVGIALAADGTLFVTDSLNHVIRTVTPGGATSLVAGRPGVVGPSPDGPAGDVAFVAPAGIAIGPSGEIYFTEQHRVRVLER